jgi:hypothetical protein
MPILYLFGCSAFGLVEKKDKSEVCTCFLRSIFILAWAALGLCKSKLLGKKRDELCEVFKSCQSLS